MIVVCDTVDLQVYSIVVKRRFVIFSDPRRTHAAARKESQQTRYARVWQKQTVNQRPQGSIKVHSRFKVQGSRFIQGSRPLLAGGRRRRRMLADVLAYLLQGIRVLLSAYQLSTLGSN